MIECASSIPGKPDYEPFFEDEVMGELGFTFEQKIFRGRNVRWISDNFRSPAVSSGAVFS